jgi:hypothetical protein
MYRRTLTILLAAAAFTAIAAGPARAQNETPKPWYQLVSVNGFASTSFGYNFNTPASKKNGYRVFDFDDNSFKIDVAELVFRKDATAPGEAGFRIDLVAGSSIPFMEHSRGLSMGDLDLQQAFVTYVAPLGRGLKLDIGKFGTPAGYEVIEGFDGYNDNATRGFLFGYAVPFTHTGLRIAYPFSDAFTATAFVVNGWDVAVDNNRSKTVGVSLGVLPAQGFTLSLNALYGPEQDSSNSAQRSLVDVVASYAISPAVTVGVNADFGAEQKVLADGSDARWMGVAAYLRLNLCADFSLALRGELFDDQDGFRTGAAQKLTGITLTPEYRPSSGFILRGDLRFDSSDKEVFEKSDGPSKTQPTVTLNAIFLF